MSEHIDQMAEVDNWFTCDCEECARDREELFEHIKACAAHPAAQERDGNRRGRSGAPTYLSRMISGVLRLGSKFGRGLRPQQIP